MANRRFEMYHYRQVIVRMRLGESDLGHRNGDITTHYSAPELEDQEIIDRILAHLRDREQDIPTLPLLLPRARHHRPEHHLRHCLFSLGRIPA
jgi:hypothetical protein